MMPRVTAIVPAADGRSPALRTAEAHATRNIPLAGSADTAGDVRRAITGRRFDSAVDVAVCEGDRFVGLVPIELLLAAAEDEPMTGLLQQPPVARPGLTQEITAWRMVQHDRPSLAVIDHDGRFVGLVPPERMLAVLLEEHEEDLSRLAGVLHQTQATRRASQEPVVRRLWHRLPWLLIGYLGALLAAGLVGRFEADIAADPRLAFFLPGVVYLADAVGTQTETVVIRGLSIGVTIRSILRRELATGAVIGIVIGALFVPAGLVLFGDLALAVAVGVAVMAACAISTVVAMVLPNLLAAKGRDPAFGSGPLATVVQDLLSIVVYFAMVVWMVR
jgi:magnesium transporter